MDFAKWSEMTIAQIKKKLGFPENIDLPDGTDLPYKIPYFGDVQYASRKFRSAFETFSIEIENENGAEKHDNL